MIEVKFLSNFAGHLAGEIVNLPKQEAEYYINLAVAMDNSQPCGCGCAKCNENEREIIEN
jgi:hypothetical protein